MGEQVEEYFKSRDFLTYFVKRVHSSDGLTDNIFKHLRNSEYFVFVNFNREKLSKRLSRGSLFVNQELAIATFLGIPGIGFHEKGVKREGIAKYHIFNEFYFEDVNQILSRLKQATKYWDNSSINELEMIYNSKCINRDILLEQISDKTISDWYHLEIHNRHKSKHAISCLAYLTKLIDLKQNKEIKIPTIELRWSGSGVTQANIIANSVQDLSVFYIIHDDDKILFN